MLARRNAAMEDSRDASVQGSGVALEDDAIIWLVLPKMVKVGITRLNQQYFALFDLKFDAIDHAMI